MGRMLTKIVGRPVGKRHKPKGPYVALADTGAAETVIASEAAREMGFRCDKPTARLGVGGQDVPVCYRQASLFVPGTDCLVESHRVAIATEPTGLPTILGADFMQRTGAFLDLRKGQHAIGCDTAGRDSKPPPLVNAKPVRLNGRR